MKYIMALLVALMALGGIAAAEPVAVEASADVDSIVELDLGTAPEADLGPIYPSGGADTVAGTVDATENWEIDVDPLTLMNDDVPLGAALEMSISANVPAQEGHPGVDIPVTASFAQAFTPGDRAGTYTGTASFTISVVT